MCFSQSGALASTGSSIGSSRGNRLPVSRLAFALGDLKTEIMALLPDEDARERALITILLDPPAFSLVVRELEYRHHGAKLQKDERFRGPGMAIRYAGMRLVCQPPGNKHG